jgi:selenocysteine lyase/cysteine desulfurase
VIQVSHITCTTGLVFPVHAIAELARAHDIWFHIDGAQSVGMIPVNLDAIGCDSYAFSGHKWLGGPHESGVFYIRHARLEAVAATGIGAHSGSLPHLPGELILDPTASRHEYGTRNAGLISGLAEAVRLQETIGRDRIAAHGKELATRLLHELAKIPDIEVLTPRHDELRASMTTIRHARATASGLFNFLKEDRGLRCRPVTEQGLQAVRISTHVFNSHAECERVIAGVRAAARAF